MKIWFIRHNNESLGPYTIEELKNLSVGKEDYVWKEGFTGWMQAKDINELNSLFKASPPSFTQHQSTSAVIELQDTKDQGIEYKFEKAGKKVGKVMQWTGMAIIALGIVSFIYYKNQSASYIAPFNSSPEQLRADLAQAEKQEPAHYIGGRTSNHQNLVNQTVLEGSLTNSATIAVFKDVVLQVDFLSKTNSVIATQNITIYEVVNPGQTITFKKKIFVSKDVANVNVTVLNAMPVN